jgi:type I restriction enzyme R subunit
VLMRPIFSPTEYIQIKGRGTRLFTFKIGNTEYEKKHFFLLDFCGVAAYFEETYDYSQPLKLPRPKAPLQPGVERHTDDGGEGDTEPGTTGGGGGGGFDIPVWHGVDRVVSEEIRIVGPDGEKVDVMTFRGSFERDVREFDRTDGDFHEAVETEDDDAVETIMDERFYYRPEMFYSPDKLVLSYGVPAPTPAFVYNALGKKPLPTREEVIADAVDSLAARFNLRYREQQWLTATAPKTGKGGGNRVKRF